MPEDSLSKDYARLINAYYPGFLKRLGLDEAVQSARGSIITDARGRSYIDCIAGHGVFHFGHNHPRILSALKDQLDRQQLWTRPFFCEEQVEAARKLEGLAPQELCCSFLCSSGSEAVDSALKLARLCTNRQEIVCARNSFHGLTLGALSATGISSFRKPFEPLLPGFVFVEYADISSLKEAVTDKTAAVLLEPVQHEAGVHLPQPGYLQEARRICSDQGALLILDEIKTGLGKTGKNFAFEHEGAVPDILLLGKSLGGGLYPAGAMLAGPWLWRIFSFSFPMSASSLAWNTLASRAVQESLEVLLEEDLAGEAARKGERFLNGLREIAARFSEILHEVHGRGLLIGMEARSSKTALSLVKGMISKGILVSTAFGRPSTLMFEPPLIISEDELEQVLQKLKESCEEI